MQSSLPVCEAALNCLFSIFEVLEKDIALKSNPVLESFTKWIAQREKKPVSCFSANHIRDTFNGWKDKEKVKEAAKLLFKAINKTYEEIQASSLVIGNIEYYASEAGQTVLHVRDLVNLVES
eukprot:106938-Hanusia_phi.AAC.2